MQKHMVCATLLLESTAESLGCKKAHTVFQKSASRAMFLQQKHAHIHTYTNETSPEQAQRARSWFPLLLQLEAYQNKLGTNMTHQHA